MINQRISEQVIRLQGSVIIGSMLLYASICLFAGSDLLPKYIQPPVTPGHEFIGKVVKLGPGIRIRLHGVSIVLFSCYCMNAGAGEKYGLEVGDHATAENIVPCWECHFCKQGNYNICTSMS